MTHKSETIIKDKARSILGQHLDGTEQEFLQATNEIIILIKNLKIYYLSKKTDCLKLCGTNYCTQNGCVEQDYKSQTCTICGTFVFNIDKSMCMCGHPVQ